MQEAMAFQERQNGPHVYEMLPRMNPNITMHFIYSSKDATAYVVLSRIILLREANMLMSLELADQYHQHTRHGDVL